MVSFPLVTHDDTVIFCIYFSFPKVPYFGIYLCRQSFAILTHNVVVLFWYVIFLPPYIGPILALMLYSCHFASLAK